MRRTQRKPDGFRDAESFAASLTSKQLHCRELGHEWRDHAVSYDPKSKSYDRSLLCRGCRTIRRQVLDRSGHIVSNSYIYQPGYLATHVEDRASLSRDVFRVEAMTRWLSSHQVAGVA